MAENRLNFVFGADLSGFSQALASVQDKLKDIGGKMKEFGSTMSTYVSLPLAALGTAAIKSYADLQSLKMGLTAVMGSAELAEKELVKLKEVAKLPGLGLKEAAQGSVSLQAAGFSADQARKSLIAFGNALATVGKGKRELDLVTLALTQLNNKTSGFGQDLRQLTEQLPQLRGALTSAFGTADSEEISKSGVTGREVVEKLTNEFAKLPKVTGGINNAFENMSDSIFNSMASIGEIIDKNFDISGILDKISASITSIVEWFQGLSPEVQNATLVFAGLAIVIPPIIAGLGVLVGTVLPALIAGFSAIISPVALVVAGIAAAAYAIYANWDAIKAYFTSGDGSTFWNTVVAYASDLWESLKSIFNTVKTTLISIWNTIGSNIKGAVSGAFSIISGIITSVLGQISGYIKIFSSLIKGDWKGVWEGVKTIAASLWNGILSVIKGGLLAVGNALSGFFKMLGADSLAKSFDATNTKIASVFNSLQIPVKKATSTVKDFNKEVAKAGNTTVKTITPVASKSKDENKEKIADVYKDLAVGLKRIDAEFGKTFDEKAKKKIDEYQQAINGLIKNGIDPLSESIKKLQVEQQKYNLLEAPKLSYKDTATVTDPNKKVTEAKMVSPLKKLTTGLTEEKLKVMTLMNEMNEGITQSINSSVASMATGFAEMLGSMASSQGNMGDIVKGLIGILGDMAIQVGKIAVSTGIAMLGIKAAFSNPITAIAAGVALIALGSLVKGQLAKATGGGGGQKAFAKGGIVSSPTNAIFGEYGNASRGNPEVVAPLNSLKSMLGDTGGMGGAVSFTIEGDKLVGVLNNYNKRTFRTS